MYPFGYSTISGFVYLIHRMKTVQSLDLCILFGYSTISGFVYQLCAEFVFAKYCLCHWFYFLLRVDSCDVFGL